MSHSNNCGTSFGSSFVPLLIAVRLPTAERILTVPWRSRIYPANLRANLSAILLMQCLGYPAETAPWMLHGVRILPQTSDTYYSTVLSGLYTVRTAELVEDTTANIPHSQTKHGHPDP